jgi:cytochrome c553
MSRHLLVLLLATLPIAAFANAPERPSRLGLCVACHGENGMALVKGTPHLAGQDRDYLRESLSQYRSGERKAAVMRASAGALSVADIGQLADWYSAQPICIGHAGCAAP